MARFLVRFFPCLLAGVPGLFNHARLCQSGTSQAQLGQLSEIAVRALSPGINDPFTAASVIERFGDALCRIAPRHLRTGVVGREGRIVLVYPVTDYAGLCDAMFHLIRQNASGASYVLIRMLEVLRRVAEVEQQAPRRLELRRHADLVMASARHGMTDQAAHADAEDRYKAFLVTLAS
ncbi:hypothetical protein BK022_06745 [Methylorubrum extorquens]|uniref:DUF2254 domain-containing protein n=1 Tax=Methylorubrum extorquens TaxID=408 RepID=A0A1S1P7H4_METEX|nr:hypothetical protein BK022_06745 [Methylorubrum extorquens]